LGNKFDFVSASKKNKKIKKTSKYEEIITYRVQIVDHRCRQGDLDVLLDWHLAIGELIEE
jgi:hypothetical protein